MITRTCIPDGPLSAFVDYFWYLESRQEAPSHELSLPDGSVDLIIDLQEDKVRMASAAGESLQLAPVFVCGPHSRPFTICNPLATRVVGIHFKPGGAFPFLGCPLDELHDRLQPMEAMWGSRAGELREELLGATSVDRLFRLLSDRLLRLATRPLERHPAVPYAIGRFDSAADAQADRVRRLVDELGISHRRFIELFRRETGYTPIGYSRIRRFQAALKELSSPDGAAGRSDLALACGYYDQAHFIKDFRVFSGLSPSGYEAIPGRHINHVHA